MTYAIFIDITYKDSDTKPEGSTLYAKGQTLLSKTKRVRRNIVHMISRYTAISVQYLVKNKVKPYDPSSMRLPCQGKRRYIFESERSPLIYLSIQFSFLKLSRKHFEVDFDAGL